MRMKLISSLGALWAVCAAVGAEPVVAGAKQPNEWRRWLIPLPKEVTLEKQVTVPAAEVAITLRDGADALERNAARKLRRGRGLHPGLEPHAAQRRHRLRFGFCAARCRRHPQRHGLSRPHMVIT